MINNTEKIAVLIKSHFVEIIYFLLVIVNEAVFIKVGGKTQTITRFIMSCFMSSETGYETQFDVVVKVIR